MRGIKAVVIRDSEFVQERGCGQIYSNVQPRHSIATLFQHAGERQHNRTNDSDNVNVFGHAMTAVSKNSSVPAPSAVNFARIPSGIVSIERCVCPTAAL